MGKRILAIVLILAAVGVIWVARWVLLWEVAVAFRPLQSMWLTDGSIPESKMDWQDHLAYGVAGQPRDTRAGGGEEWRLEHLRRALETCPKDARPLVQVATVSMAHDAVRRWPYVPGWPGGEMSEKARAMLEQFRNRPAKQQAAARLAQVAAVAQKENPDNGYFDIALADAAFARGETEAAVSHLLAASQKPYRNYLKQMREATLRAIWRAHILPTPDPMFADWADMPLYSPNLGSAAALFGTETALSRAKQGQLEDAKGLLRGIMAVGTRIQEGQEGADSLRDRLPGLSVTSVALRAYRQAAILYGAREEALTVAQKTDEFAARSHWTLFARTGDEFYLGEHMWNDPACLLFREAVSVIRILPGLLVIFLLARLAGAGQRPERTLSSGRLALVLLAAMMPPLLVIAGWYTVPPMPYGGDWHCLVRTLAVDSTWLLTVAFLLFLAFAVEHDAAGMVSRSSLARIVLGVLFAGGLLGAGVVLAWLVSEVRDVTSEGIDTADAVSLAGAFLFAALCLVMAVWSAILLRRGEARSAPGGEAADTGPTLGPRSDWAGVARTFAWLTARLLVACVALVFLGLLFHAVFVLWIGGHQPGVLPPGHAPYPIIKPGV